MQSLSLWFEKMPERHAELAWRFGEPDECHENENENEEGEGGTGNLEESWWVLRSPLPPEEDVATHLAWAADCLRPHEAFVGELISLGGRVVLKLRHEGDGTAFLSWNARLLLPMAHTGVEIDFKIGKAGKLSE